jgi:hypothetical protein
VTMTVRRWGDSALIDQIAGDSARRMLAEAL